MVVTASSGIGITLIVVGVILVIIGVILYELNVQNNKPQGWWVWLLIGLGVGGVVIGAIITMSFLRKPPPVY